MVSIKTEEAAKYPNFANLVLKVLPTFAAAAHVTTALWKCAGVDAAGERGMKDLGGTALVKIACGASGPPEIATWLIFGEFNRAAEYRPSDPDRVHVNINWIVKFEQDHAKAAAQRFMLATVLHEIVHYLDFKLDGRFFDAEIIDGKMKIDQDKERGHLFEKMVFGGTVKPW
jgi:hypothetical protein